MTLLNTTADYSDGLTPPASKLTAAPLHILDRPRDWIDSQSGVSGSIRTEPPTGAAV